MISKNICRDKKLIRLAREVRYHFVLLITWADNLGRLEGDAEILNGMLYPYDKGIEEPEIDQMNGQLQHDKFIKWYTVGDCKYIQIRNFKKYQVLKNHQNKSDFPAPSEHRSDTSEQRSDKGVHEVEVEEEVEENISGVKPPPNPAAEARRSLNNQADQCFENWRTITGKVKSKRTADKLKHFKARLREGWTVEELRMVAQSAAKNPWNKGDNPSGKEYFSVANLYRNSEKVEHHLQDYLRGPRTGDPTADKTRAQIERMKKLREAST